MGLTEVSKEKNAKGTLFCADVRRRVFSIFLLGYFGGAMHHQTIFFPISLVVQSCLLCAVVVVAPPP